MGSVRHAKRRELDGAFGQSRRYDDAECVQQVTQVAREGTRREGKRCRRREVKSRTGRETGDGSRSAGTWLEEGGEEEKGVQVCLVGLDVRTVEHEEQSLGGTWGAASNGPLAHGRGASSSAPLAPRGRRPPAPPLSSSRSLLSDQAARLQEWVSPGRLGTSARPPCVLSRPLARSLAPSTSRKTGDDDLVASPTHRLGLTTGQLAQQCTKSAVEPPTPPRPRSRLGQAPKRPRPRQADPLFVHRVPLPPPTGRRDSTRRADSLR